VSAGLRFTPGRTISSMRSSVAASGTTSAAGSRLSRCSIVRGPMIADVTPGWSTTKAMASSIIDSPASSATCAS